MHRRPFEGRHLVEVLVKVLDLTIEKIKITA